MTDVDLLQKFDALIVEGQNRYSNYIKSHDELRRCLVRIYLWWAESNSNSNVMKEIEQRYDMPVVKIDGNRPNFTNLLRIIFGKTEAYDKEYVKVWQWGAAISALHEEYADHPQRYRKNPEGTLLKFFNDRGGISGLLKKDDVQSSEEAFEEKTKKPKSNKKSASPDMVKAIRQQAVEWLKTVNGIGTAAPNSPLRVDHNGHIALLARREASGKITLLGSTNNTAAVAALAQHMMDTEISHLPESLRLLVEIIRSQMYPFNALPQNLDNRTKWYRSVLLDQSPIKTNDLPNWQEGDRKVALWAPRKLLIRGSRKDVIFSNSKSSVSVVTCCIPKTFPIEFKDEVFLRVIERSSIERMLETGEMQVTTASPSKELRRSNKTEKFRYELALTNKHRKKPLTLHFYDTKPYAGSLTGFQADFDFSAFKPIWQFKADANWFGKFREKMLDQWFSVFGGGNRPNRPNNRHMEINITSARFRLLFNISEHGSAPADMAVNAKLHGNIKNFKNMHLSKDIAPVLYNLADVVTNGMIQVRGNADATVFEYENDLGLFKIAVPTAIKTGKSIVRKATAFSDYRYA